MDIAELPSGTHQDLVTPRRGSSKANFEGSIGESLEYGDIQTKTKLEDCALVKVEKRMESLA